MSGDYLLHYEEFGYAVIRGVFDPLGRRIAVVMSDGGPSEIFEDHSGVLVDPFDADDIARGLLDALTHQGTLACKARALVLRKYTWQQTANGYLEAIEDIPRPDNNLMNPDACDLIRSYLESLS